MKKIKTKFEKLIRRLFFKYCYNPRSINAERYNIIPINSVVFVDERYIYGKWPFEKDKKVFEYEIREELARNIAKEIVNTINIEEYYDIAAQKFQYRARLFIAEDKPFNEWKKGDIQL